MTKLQQLKKRALKNADIHKEYDALAEEFAIINQLRKMRNAAGLTQEEQKYSTRPRYCRMINLYLFRLT